MSGCLPGSSNPTARLSVDQIKIIRREWSLGQVTCRALAARFGVCLRTMYGIVRGETYVDPEYCPPLNANRDTKKGERHNMARLSAADVVEIRRLIKKGGMTLTAIGEMFGVSRSHIGGIRRGRFWRHVGP